jgi:superfamily I DNA and RNA helicase
VTANANDRAAKKWGTESTKGYRRDAFYTQASDRQGHSAKYQVKVPTNIAGELAAIIQSGKIPEYRTPQDIFRDALIHQLHYLERIVDDPEFSRRISMAIIHQDLMTKQSEREEFYVLMEAIKEEIAHLQTTGQGDKLRRYLVDLLDKAEEAIPQEFLADFNDEIRQRLRIAGGKA